MNNSQTNDSNPCCSGQWSRTAEKDSYQPGERVLILVVVEDGLVPKYSCTEDINAHCLNPYCSGRQSRTYSYYFAGVNPYES